MRKSALSGAKNIRFFEIYGVSARTREEGSIFRDFVRNCGCPLWTAPYDILMC